jgi:hypothetical protein
MRCNKKVGVCPLRGNAENGIILITAVRNGELDDQLAPAKKPVTAMTTRKAA